MQTEEDILLGKVAQNSVGVSDALLPSDEIAKKVLLEGVDGGTELNTLVSLVICDKIKFDESRKVYTNENDLKTNPESQLGSPYNLLMERAVTEEIFIVGDDGKVSLSDSAKQALVAMQRERDTSARPAPGPG